MEHTSKIIELDEHDLIQSIQSNTISVCVIGIGRIGLPTALSFANSGISTIGVDINSELVEMINSKIFPLKDSDPAHVSEQNLATCPALELEAVLAVLLKLSGVPLSTEINRVPVD